MRTLVLGFMVFLCCNSVNSQTPDLLQMVIETDDFKGTKKEFLTFLETKSKLSFSYTSYLNVKESISIGKQKKSIKEFLDILFSDQQVEYQLNGDKIILLVRKDLRVKNNPIQNIRGIVTDMESGFPIPGANILVAGTDPVIGAVTSPAGEFLLSGIIVGRYTLQASFVGYETKTIPEILVGSAKEIFLEIKLSENPFKLNEVDIRPVAAKGTPLNEMATVSSRSFSLEEGKRYPASIDDPGRMALVYAGVSSADDASNEIIIRGNTPNGLLWRIEGVEVPSPNHFYEEGESAGFVSMLSANMVGKSDFFTGAFPAEYGNASSGVFDIYLRNGNNKEREYTFQVGLLGTDFALEGPFSKDHSSSYLFNYRYSTLGLIEKIGFKFRESLIPAFQDLCFKLNFPTKNLGTFSFWALGGSGDATVNALSDPKDWEENDDRETDVSKMKMGVTGLNHVLFLGTNTFIRSSVSLSAQETINDIWYYDNDLNYIHDFGANKRNASIKASTTINKKFSSWFSLKSGFVYTKLFFDYFEKSYSWNSEIIKNKGNSYYLQAFVQSKFKLSNKLSITPGLHYLYLGLNNNKSVEPRVGVNYTLSKNKVFGLGFGIHSKMELLSTYFGKLNINGNYTEPNKYLDLAKAYHYVISYDHYFNADLHARVEVYYQHLFNVPVINKYPYTISPLNSENHVDTFLNKGFGKNTGVELTVEKFFTKGYFFLATGSLYDSKIKYLDNNWYNSRYNGKFITNFIAGREFKVGIKKNNFLNVNGKVIWSGGRRATPLKYYQFDNLQDFMYDYSKSYGKQFQNYFRIDLGISYRLNKLNVAHVFSLDIQNATNRKNILEADYYYYPASGGGFNAGENAVYQMGIMPVFKYRIEF